MIRPNISGAALTLSVALLFWAPAATPAAAKKGPGCLLFTPGLEEAAGAPIAQVTDAARAATPLTIEYEQGPSVATAAEDTLYFNIQLYTRRAHPGIYVRQDFERTSDIDLHLYNNDGNEVASSTAFNLVPVDVGPFEGTSNGSGGFGYESITGFRAGKCDQYTLASSAVLTEGTPVTLKIWLGAPTHAE